MCVCVFVCVRVFDNGPGDLGSISGRVIPKIQKKVMDAALRIWHYQVRIEGKWSNLWKVVVPPPTLSGSIYWKGRLWVSLYFSQLIYLCINIYIYININVFMWMYAHMYVYMYININICIYIYIYMGVYIYVRVCVYNIYIYIYIYIYIFNMCICVNIYLHICM